MAFNIHTHMREHGENREAIKNLKAAVAGHEAKLSVLNASLNQARGAWKSLAVVGTVAGCIGGIVARLLSNVSF